MGSFSKGKSRNEESMENMNWNAFLNMTTTTNLNPNLITVGYMDFTFSRSSVQN